MFVKGIELTKKEGHFYLRNPLVGIQIEVNNLGYEIIEKIIMAEDLEKAYMRISDKQLKRKDFDEFISTLKKLCVFVDEGSEIQSNWTVEWDITYGCNLQCRHCMVKAGQPLIDELNTRQAKQLVDQLREANFKILVISGGEPLIRKDFPNILKYAYSKSFFIKVLTNATLIDDNKAKLLADYGVIYCQISLDGPDEKSYEFIRGPGNFKSLIGGLEKLKRSGVNFGTTMVLTENNFPLIEDTIRLSINLGASNFSIGPLVETGRALDSGLKSPQGQYDFHADLECYRLAKKYKKTIKVHNYIDNILEREKLRKSGHLINSCSRINQGIAIYPNGMVSFCKGFFGKCDLSAVTHNTSFILGKFPVQSIEDILKKRSKFNFNIIENSPDCKACEIADLCLGGCPAEAFGKYGDFKIPSNQCNNKKEQYTQLLAILSREDDS